MPPPFSVGSLASPLRSLLSSLPGTPFALTEKQQNEFYDSIYTETTNHMYMALDEDGFVGMGGQYLPSAAFSLSFLRSGTAPHPSFLLLV